jgi:hypothetical protein
MQRVTRYAKSGEVHIAYQVFGEGPDLGASFLMSRIRGTNRVWNAG